jgi:hypothetical protein
MPSADQAIVVGFVGGFLRISQCRIYFGFTMRGLPLLSFFSENRDSKSEASAFLHRFYGFTNGVSELNTRPIIPPSLNHEMACQSDIRVIKSMQESARR